MIKNQVGQKRFSPEVKKLFSTATHVSPQPRMQNLLPTGDFLDPENPPLYPVGPSTSPLVPPPPPCAPAPPQKCTELVWRPPQLQWPHMANHMSPIAGPTHTAPISHPAHHPFAPLGPTLPPPPPPPPECSATSTETRCIVVLIKTALWHRGTVGLTPGKSESLSGRPFAGLTSGALWLVEGRPPHR